MDISLMDRIDSNGMYRVYDEWPKIAKESFEQDLKPVSFERSDHVVFAGMGGSGAIGDIFSSILSKTNIHVEVVKGYLLPKTVDSNSIVVVTSISGNTEETNSVLKSAIEIGCKIVAFSDGGMIEKNCEGKSVDYRKISMIHSPRSSFTKFLYSMLKILEPILPIAQKDVQESINQLEKLQKEIFSGNLDGKNPSLELANWLSNSPLIYYPWGLQASAIRFKNSLQENAKIHAVSEDIIEACHNGIVAWEKNSNLKPILLQGKDDFIKTKERWEILKEFFIKKNIQFYEIHSVNGSILSKIINLIYLLDYASIYKSIMSEIDPTPVNAIDFIKSKL